MADWFNHLKHRYRVDTVPWWLAPFFWSYAGLLAAPYFFYVRLCRATCKVSVTGDLPAGPAIHCLWHRNAMIYFILDRYRGDVWINHPYWYMKPAQLALRWLGLKGFALGSTGSGGRDAANEVVKSLQHGKSTLITPDGPNGPRGEIKKGVLHMAVQAGCPVVVFQCHCHPRILLRGWDQKVLPIPFLSSIQVRISKPIEVVAGGFDFPMEKIREWL